MTSFALFFSQSPGPEEPEVVSADVAEGASGAELTGYPQLVQNLSFAPMAFPQDVHCIKIFFYSMTEFAQRYKSFLFLIHKERIGLKLEKIPKTCTMSGQ